MSILDTFRKRTAAPAKPDATAPASSAAEGLTMEGLLKELAEQRPGIEQRFEAQAILKAADLRSARKIFPEAEGRIAYEFLTAMCDDAQFGTKVLFCQRNPETGDVDEVEGTRVQQLEAKWAEAAPHSLADERVAAVRQGHVKAYALPSGGGETAHSPQSAKKDPGEQGVDMDVAEALAKSGDSQAQATLDRMRKEGKVATGANSNAVN